MKTRYIYILAMGLSLAVSCNPKEARELPAPAGIISVHASLPGTKVAARDTESGTGLSWLWEEGDELSLVGVTSSVLSIDEGFTGKSATFSGAPVSGTEFSIIYPGSISSEEAFEAINFEMQTQPDLSSKDALQYCAMLQGLKSFDSFEFSPSWAEAAGASLRSVGVLRITGTLPAETTTVSRIKLSASAPVLYADNAGTPTQTLTLAFENSALPESKSFTAWFNTSCLDAPLPAGTTLTLEAAAGDFTWLCDITLSEDKTLRGGVVNTIDVPVSLWYNTGRYSGGAGTPENPWIITQPEQMLFMSEDLVGGELRCFRLGADIDMSEIEGWIPLNYASPFDRQIDFDGAGHTVSGFTCDYPDYPSFFGVLYGNCHDVTFAGASINCSTNKSCGILGGYCGSGDKKGSASRVHVEGDVLFTGNKTGVGGMFGILGNAVLQACSADVTVSSSKNYVGGLFGYAQKGATVENCWSAGAVAGGQRVGGLGGGTTAEDVVVRNCYSTASVSGAYALGGIAGHCNMDKGNEADTRMPANVFEKCIAWNSFVRSNSFSSGDKSHYSCGAVIGFTATHNYLTDCVRRSDLDFKDYSDLFVIYDQQNASVETPLVINPVEGADYNYPYHGTAAAAGATLSQIAQGLGWSGEVWDFSAELPILK